MKLLIFTSKDHLYGNLVLNRLLASGVLDAHELVVFEQDWVVPNRPKWQGLWRYARKAGVRYVASQAAKQLTFIALRGYHALRHDHDALLSPYFENSHPAFRRTLTQGLKRPALQAEIAALAPDMILSVYSKEILPPEILAIPPLGSINLHPALLPDYKGVSPTFWCLVNHESQAGVTLHALDAGIDTGAVIAQQALDTAPHRTEHSLYLECSERGAALLIDYLRRGEFRKTRASAKAAGRYFSVPTRAAVKKFHASGYRFFTFAELRRGAKK